MIILYRRKRLLNVRGLKRQEILDWVVYLNGGKPIGPKITRRTLVAWLHENFIGINSYPIKIGDVYIESRRCYDHVMLYYKYCEVTKNGNHYELFSQRQQHINNSLLQTGCRICYKPIILQEWHIYARAYLFLDIRKKVILINQLLIKNVINYIYQLLIEKYELYFKIY